jgi:hypothetical protein
MMRMSLSSRLTEKRKEYGGVECNCREAGLAPWWSGGGAEASRAESRKAATAKAQLGRAVEQARHGRPSGIVGRMKLGMHIPLEFPPHISSSCVTPLWVDKHGPTRCGGMSVVGTCNAVWRNWLWILKILELKREFMISLQS